jgi:hypothetical protein
LSACNIAVLNPGGNRISQWQFLHYRTHLALASRGGVSSGVLHLQYLSMYCRNKTTAHRANPMKRLPFWEADSSSANQEMPSTLWSHTLYFSSGWRRLKLCTSSRTVPCVLNARPSHRLRSDPNNIWCTTKHEVVSLVFRQLTQVSPPPPNLTSHTYKQFGHSTNIQVSSQHLSKSVAMATSQPAPRLS